MIPKLSILTAIFYMLCCLPPYQKTSYSPSLTPKVCTPHLLKRVLHKMYVVRKMAKWHSSLLSPSWGSSGQSGPARPGNNEEKSRLSTTKRVPKPSPSQPLSHLHSSSLAIVRWSSWYSLITSLSCKELWIYWRTKFFFWGYQSPLPQ